MQKRRDTRACSGDENAFADKPRTWRLGDGDGSDGCARRWTQILARDRNLLMLAFGSWGRCSWETDANATFNMHGSDEPDQPDSAYFGHDRENEPCEMS
jgi:hypothetical protein